ncbi:MAG: C1 family peptidase [Pseudomonadota bacterium]
MPTTSFQFQGNKLALDARPDRLDLRDRMYAPRVCSLPPFYPDTATVKKYLPKYIKAGMVLDQGSEGACTGFGLAAVINYLLWLRDPRAKQTSPRMLYHLAKFYDEWAGQDYTGSSCRGALKGWHKHGVCSRELWPYTVAKDKSVPAFEAPKKNWAQDAVSRPLGVYYRVDKSSVTEMQAAILEIGAIYVSANVHQGWRFSTAKPKAKKLSFSSYKELPVIEWSPTSIGGHAFALIGYTDQGFVVQNSWGTEWGHLGFAILTYEDWVANGTDAWTVSLGVPVRHGAISAGNRPNQATNLQHGAGLAHISTAPAFRPGSSLLAADPPAAARADGLPILSQDQAYGLTVVMGNDGGLIQRIVQAENAEATVDQVLLASPLEWLKKQKDKQTLKLALYAHGGLNSEEDSLKRIGVMAPYFLANGIYPVFITWKTGLLETFTDILADKIKDFLPGASLSFNIFENIKNAAIEAADRTVEAVSESIGGKSQWVQMKQNAGQAALDGAPPRGLFVMAERLQQLAAKLGQQLEIHLVGHSAGSIVHGHLLQLLAQRQLKVSSCSLFAPACTVEFANQSYRAAIEQNFLQRKDFHIHLMSDARELDDNVASIYHKSLLYLVARAFETLHKTPLLGMATSLDGSYFVRKDTADDQWNSATRPVLSSWNNFYWGGDIPSGFAASGEGLAADLAKTLHIVNAKTVNCGRRQIPTAHGSFDNDIDTVAATLARILGLKSTKDLPQAVLDLDY